MTTAGVRTSAPALRLLAALLAAAVANSLIALVASSLDAGGTSTGLDPAIYLPATVVGVAIAATGWLVLRRRAPGSLRIVVPAALVVSWVPDLLLLGAGATVVNVVALMLMHAVIAASVVAALR